MSFCAFCIGFIGEQGPSMGCNFAAAEPWLLKIRVLRFSFDYRIISGVDRGTTVGTGRMSCLTRVAYY